MKLKVSFQSIAVECQKLSFVTQYNGRLLAAKMAKPQRVGVPASAASVLIGLLALLTL